MINLLHAGFTRLRKHKLFWILTIFSIALALFMIYTKYNNMKQYGDVIELEQIIFQYSTIIGIVIAIFTSLFLGVEYSDGAIRNKVSIGHSRIHIYCSNLLITIVVTLYSYLLFLIVVAIVGIPLFGGITISITHFFMIFGSIFVTMIAYCSIFTFISMVISNKTMIAIVNILVSFGLIVSSLICLSILSETEFIHSAEITNMETGDYNFVEVPNPHYPNEMQRKIYQTLLDINPAGQMFQIAGKAALNFKILPIYSLGIIIVFTGLGLVIFQKKELR